MRVHPFRTILLIIGFLGISMTVMLAFSMKDVFHTYFYGNLAETYQDIDLKVTVNTDSDLRFFRTRFLDDENITAVADGLYPFFEYDVVTKIDSDVRHYVHVYASSLDMLSHLSDVTYIANTTLADDEVIITRSYAKKYMLSVGDSITLEAGVETKDFNIVEILNDGKLFQGDSIFIDKTASFSFFLSAFDENLLNLTPPSSLATYHNVLYVDLKDGVSHDAAKAAFCSVLEYRELNYIDTIDEITVNQLVNRNTASLGGLLCFVFVSILLVLETTLRYYFHDKKSQATMIHILGGKTRYALSILEIELLIEQTIAFVLAIIIVNSSIRFGMNYLDSAWIYRLSSTMIWLSLAVTLGIFIMMFTYYSHRSRTMPDMHEMRLSGDERKLNWKWLLLVSMVSLLLFGLLYIPKLSDLLGHYASILRILLSLVCLLFIAPVLFYGAMMITKKYRERRLIYFHLRILASKKGFSHFLSVSLVVSLVIFLLIFMMQHMNQRIDVAKSEFDFDLIVTRMGGNEEAIYQDVATLDTVSSVIRADIYEHVVFGEGDTNINYVLSMDINEADTYFNLDDLTQQISQLATATEPAILLPSSYHEIYRYDLHDTIALTLDPDDGVQLFSIAGFFEKQDIGIAFTNLYMIDENVRTKANSLLVRANGSRQTLTNQLLDRYSNQLIIIYDFQKTYIEPAVLAMERIKNFIIGYLSLVMICFIMSLINHHAMIQIEREADDARMIAIGYRKKDMKKETIYEGLIVLCVVMLSSIVAYVMVVGQIQGLFAVFGAYENIVFKPNSILIGSGINVLLFSMMWISRIKRQPNVRLIDYLRTY